MCTILLVNCGSSKPSWEYKKAPDSLFEAVNIKDNPKVTKNDKTILGVLFSGMVLFVRGDVCCSIFLSSLLC